MRKLPKSLPAEQPRTLIDRAAEEMGLWRNRLGRKDREKLWTPISSWGRQGGSIITLGLRHGKTARRNKKLKRDREARLEAEQTAYEARRTRAAPIVRIESKDTG